MRLFLLVSLFFVFMTGFQTPIAEAAQYRAQRMGAGPVGQRFVLEITNEHEAEFVRVFADRNLRDTVEITYGAWANNDNASALNDYIQRGKSRVLRNGPHDLKAEFWGGISKPACLTYQERLGQQPKVQGVCLVIDVLVPEAANVRQMGRGVFEIDLKSGPSFGQYVDPYEFDRILQSVRYYAYPQDKQAEVSRQLSGVRQRGLSLTSQQIARLVLDTGFGVMDAQQKVQVFEESAQLTPEIFAQDLEQVVRSFGRFESWGKVQVIRQAPLRIVTARQLVLILRWFDRADTVEKLEALEDMAAPLVLPSLPDREMILREFPDTFDRQQADRILYRYGK